ncbi:MAG: hypothetical protein D6741_13295, partial [Planctomycetota bacterium]
MRPEGGAAASLGGRSQSALEGHAAQLQERWGNVQSAAHDAVNAWTTGPQPFTAAWYAQHPNAWKATHPYAPAAVPITATSVAAWLAAPAVSADGTVVAQEQTISSTDDVDSVTTDPASDYGVSEGNPAAAPAPAEQWMTLGVFTVYAPGETLPTRMIELALSKEGRVGGTFFDRMLDQAVPVTGDVDRGTMTLRWKIGENGGV